MKRHLEQVNHNQEFLAVIEGHSPEKYFDWKITIVFYSALHYLRGLEKLKKLTIPNSHKDMFENINPKLKGAIMPVSKDCYEAYRDLYNLTRSARYSGIIDPKNQALLMKSQLATAKRHYQKVKQYCHDNNVK